MSFNKIILGIIVLSFIFPPQLYILAQKEEVSQVYLSLAGVDLNKICESISKIEKFCDRTTKEECRKLLEQCEKYFDAKAKEVEKDISKTASEKRTLSNEISVLLKKIQDLDYRVRQNNLSIKNLGLQIDETQSAVEETSEKLDKSEQQLKNVLREVYEKEKTSLVEMILTKDTLSEFFDELFYLEILSSKMKIVLEEFKELKDYLEEKESTMTEQRGELESLVKVQILQKQQSEEVKKERDYLLKMTEAEYRKYVAEKERIDRQASEIRSRIFQLFGVPDTQAPTFGEAYEIAKWVKRATGVRPALLLAILTQESNIGRNVGRCYLSDLESGETYNINTGQKFRQGIHPTRDLPPFLQITRELGLDSLRTPVSCQIPAVGGWGGAMGPAQFIPSTWMLYRNKIAAILGRAPNPWDIRDSFLAAGVLLADVGAARQTPEAEWRAAMIYFSGSTNPRYRFYGDSVMALARQIQRDIDVLEQAK